MFIFAHVGITLGAAVLTAKAVTMWKGSRNTRSPDSSIGSSTIKDQTFLDKSGFRSLSKFLDIRILMVGSMFPDIVDKPLAFFGFGSGRSISHTLLVFLVILATALYLFLKLHKTWLLALAIGIFTHLVLDIMWVTPKILFWPVYGLEFARPVSIIGFEQIHIWWNTLITDPAVDISEGIGLVVLLAFGCFVIFQRGLKTFMTTGKI